MKARFEVGDVLRPTCNPNGNITYRVIKRTDQTITINDCGDHRRCNISHDADGNEIFVLRCGFGGRRAAVLNNKLFRAKTKAEGGN